MEQQCDGVSFCEALDYKFSLQPELEELDGLDNIVIKSYVHHQPNLDKKKIIGLDHCNISKCGEDGDVKRMCPIVQELDLSSNLIEEWNEILNITKQLEHLNFVNISHNPLNKSTLCSSSYEVQKPIKKLALNRTQTDIETLIDLLQLFPNLSELHMSVNGITEVPTDINTKFKNVKVLYIAKNDLKDWDEIRKIGKIFPKLVSLNVSDNPLESVSVNENIAHQFQDLERLNIMNTKIDQWESIENLKNLERLKELRVKGSPVYQSKSLTEKQHRLLTIARLPKLDKLNGSSIDCEEREDAERMFIRFYMQNDVKPSRYSELIDAHGRLDALAEINFDQSLIVNVIVKGDIEAPFIYKLDCSKTVQTLYKELGAKLNLSKGKFRLIHLEQEEEETFYAGSVIELKTRRLTQHHVRDGDTIKVMRLDLDDVS